MKDIKLMVFALLLGAFVTAVMMQAWDRTPPQSVALARVDTVRIRDSILVNKYVRNTSIIRDTLLQNLTDTVLVKEYIYQTDTLRIACLACIASASRTKVVADSIIRDMTPSKFRRSLPYVAFGGGLILGAWVRGQ